MNLPTVCSIRLVPNVLSNKFALVLILTAMLMALRLPPAAAQTVPPPHDGLGSNHNYYLYHDGKPIMGLTVVVEITKDVVCDDIGFHLQLNANSPDGVQTNWQQYVMGFNPNYMKHGKSLGPIIGASIEYFSKPNGFNSHPPVAPIKNLPGPRTLPAGAVYKIVLRYDGKDVSGADFTFTEKNNKNHHSWTVPVPPAGVPKAVRTPIVAFQLNLVGKSGGDRAITKSGEGTITYSSSEPMTVVNKKPPSKGQTTAETANSVYGELPPGPSETFTQTFHFTRTTSEK